MAVRDMFSVAEYHERGAFDLGPGHYHKKSNRGEMFAKQELRNALIKFGSS
jgi:hypothetical protein